MNILYITNHLNTGGITSYCLTLAAGMKQKGHRVYIASSGGEMLPQFEKQGIIYIRIPIRTKSEISPKMLFSFFALRKFLKANPVDILHAHSRTTQVLAEYLSRVTKIPYLTTCHGFFKTRFSRRRFPCWGKKVIAISEPVKRHLTDDFKVGEDKISVINNGIDTDKFIVRSSQFTAEAKKKLGLEGGPVVGTVGRLSDVKGQRYLIEAMPQVLEIFPQAKLLIIGDGKAGKSLLKLAQGLLIEKNVVFIPALSDTAEALAAMDIFVMPSLQEGLGLALMEAMGMGLPVIGSAVGGIKNLIQNNRNGLLVEPRDVRGLASAMIELLKDRERAHSLGEAARRLITENFSQEKMTSQTEALYQEVLSTPGSAC